MPNSPSVFIPLPQHGRYLCALAALLLSLAGSAYAQSGEPTSPSSPVTTGGTLALSSAFNGHGSGLVGINAGLDRHRGPHAVGVRASFSERFKLEPSRRWEFGVLYTFTIDNRLSLGSGVGFVSEQGLPEPESNALSPNRFGVPLEITFRVRDTGSYGPFVRVSTNINPEGSFSVLHIGIAF